MNLPDVSNIVCLKADINYTIFHLNDGKKITSSFTLKRFEERKEFDFFLRVNRGSLVNPSSIQRIVKLKNTAFVRLTNGEQIRVSRRRVGVINLKLNNI